MIFSISSPLPLLGPLVGIPGVDARQPVLFGELDIPSPQRVAICYSATWLFALGQRFTRPEPCVIVCALTRASIQAANKSERRTAAPLCYSFPHPWLKLPIDQRMVPVNTLPCFTVPPAHAKWTTRSPAAIARLSSAGSAARRWRCRKIWASGRNDRFTRNCPVIYHWYISAAEGGLAWRARPRFFGMGAVRQYGCQQNFDSKAQKSTSAAILAVGMSFFRSARRHGRISSLWSTPSIYLKISSLTATRVIHKNAVFSDGDSIPARHQYRQLHH